MADQREEEAQDAAERRRINRDFGDMLQAARQVNGFERFMLPETFEAISQGARRGPVIVFLASHITCQALAIKAPDQVEQVLLPDLSSALLGDLARHLGIGTKNNRSQLRNRAAKFKHGRTHPRVVEQVLEVLWTKCMRAVIEALGLKVRFHGHISENCWI